MAVREFKPNDEVLVKSKNKTALLFFIPGHCAGCKRAINILNSNDLGEWDVALVDSENLEFRDLIKEFNIYTAPTLIFRKDDKMEIVQGLKLFLEEYKKIFDLLN